MGLQAAPAYLGSGNYQHPATLDRSIIRSLTGNRTGVFDIADFVVAPTTGLNVTIAKGAASMLGTDSPAAQGHYYAWSDATETKACVAAHATLKRIDALVLRVTDAAYSGGYTQGATWEWISGSPNASPVAPTDSDINTAGAYKPGSWLRVANVQINNGDTVVDPSRVFDTKYYTVNANGVMYAANATARVAITNKVPGDKCYQIDTKNTWEWDGTYWLPQVGQCVAKLRRNATASQSSGVVVGLDAEDWDLLNAHDNATNNSRYTVPFPGKWEFNALGHHAPTTTSAAVIVAWKKNGTGAGQGANTAANSSGSAGTNLVCVEVFQLAVNDYIEFTIGNAPGAAAGDTSGSLLMVTYQGP